MPSRRAQQLVLRQQRSDRLQHSSRPSEPLHSTPKPIGSPICPSSRLRRQGSMSLCQACISPGMGTLLADLCVSCQRAPNQCSAVTRYWSSKHMSLCHIKHIVKGIRRIQHNACSACWIKLALIRFDQSNCRTTHPSHPAQVPFSDSMTHAEGQVHYG